MLGRLGASLFVIAVAAACAGRGTAREVSGVRINEDRKGLWNRAMLAPDSAIKIALNTVPGGQIIKAELEEEGGRLIYSFDITTTGKAGEDEVHVDATTGKVLKVEHED